MLGIVSTVWRSTDATVSRAGPGSIVYRTSMSACRCHARTVPAVLISLILTAVRVLRGGLAQTASLTLMSVHQVHACTVQTAQIILMPIPVPALLDTQD
jgi:hypothetical protein